MRIRDPLRRSLGVGVTALLLLLGVAEGHGERVVNANEPIVILDDITKRVRTVESRSFPPKTQQPGSTEGPEERSVPGGDSSPPGPDRAEPSNREEVDWPGAPPVTEPAVRSPQAPPRATPPAARAGRETETPDLPDPSRRDSTPERDDRNREPEEGATSPSAGSSSEPGGIRGGSTTTRPLPAKADVTVTTGEGNIGSVELDELDPNTLSPEIRIDP